MGPRATIADVARAAGVSKGAASHALNGRRGVSETTRKRVQDAAAALGWSPNGVARALSGARAGSIGWAIVRSPKSSTIDPYFTELFAGIELALAETPVSLVTKLVTHRGDEDDLYRRWAAERRVDGVLLSDIDAHDGRFALLDELGMPFVAFRSRRDAEPEIEDGPFAPSIWFRERAFAAALLDLALQNGHRRIGWISGDPVKAAVVIREQVTVEWARAHNATVVTAFTDYSPADGARAAVDLLGAADPPTFLVFDSDIMALAGVSACHALGLRVPADVSITSFIDSPLCEVAMPPITALTQPIVEFGRQMTLRMLEVLGDEIVPLSSTGTGGPSADLGLFDTNGDRILPGPGLVSRASVGPRPGS